VEEGGGRGPTSKGIWPAASESEASTESRMIHRGRIIFPRRRDIAGPSRSIAEARARARIRGETCLLHGIS